MLKKLSILNFIFRPTLKYCSITPLSARLFSIMVNSRLMYSHSKREILSDILRNEPFKTRKDKRIAILAALTVASVPEVCRLLNVTEKTVYKIRRQVSKTLSLDDAPRKRKTTKKARKKRRKDDEEEEEEEDDEGEEGEEEEEAQFDPEKEAQIKQRIYDHTDGCFLYGPNYRHVFKAENMMP